MDKIEYGPYLKELLLAQFRDFIDNVNSITLDTTLTTMDSEKYTMDGE